jgi:hypothetical protein
VELYLHSHNVSMAQCLVKHRDRFTFTLPLTLPKKTVLDRDPRVHKQQFDIFLEMIIMMIMIIDYVILLHVPAPNVENFFVTQLLM